MKNGFLPGTLVAFAVLLGATAGHAHPGYPATVSGTLHVDLPKIDPPNGCQLCHTDAAGGTSLRPFGQRLVATYGLDSSPSAENDPSLIQALTGLQMGDPLLAQDLQKGVDPNPDVTNDPTPQYGCAAAKSRCSAPQSAAVIAGLLAAVLERRRARTRRSRTSARNRPVAARKHSAEPSRKRHRRDA
jgi:hypothetical protein